VVQEEASEDIISDDIFAIEDETTTKPSTLLRYTPWWGEGGEVTRLKHSAGSEGKRAYPPMRALDELIYTVTVARFRE